MDSWAPISIGANVLMNGDIDLLSAQHDVDSPDFVGDARGIVIGDYVWLPLGIKIMPGVSIGRCAVVGTGSIVTSDVEPYAVVAGNPARLVKKRAEVDFVYVPSDL